MANIQCKMCGGSMQLPDGMTCGTCAYCGSLVTFPKITNTDVENIYNRAEHYRRIHEYDKALAEYEKVVDANPEDAEAFWGLVLCRYGIEYVEDPVSHERIPTCHRVQYESILADADYLTALDLAGSYEKELYETEAKRITEIQKGILAISNQEDPFDVFICYKESDEFGKRTRDSVIAQDIYYALQQEGLKVFFSRITLESKLGSQYEPYIFAALNSAKAMLVIGSKKEYFEAVWVKNEWSRFLALKKKDRSKLLIPCYKDMDAYDIPEELSIFQSQDMSKIGFVQDILHGIKKVAGKKSADASAATNAAAAAEKQTIDFDNQILHIKFLLAQSNSSDAAAASRELIKYFPNNCWGYYYLLLAENMASDLSDLNLGKVINGKQYQFLKQMADQELTEMLNAKEQEYNAQLEEDRRRATEAHQRTVVKNQWQRNIDILQENIATLQQHLNLATELNDTTICNGLQNAITEAEALIQTILQTDLDSPEELTNIAKRFGQNQQQLQLLLENTGSLQDKELRIATRKRKKIYKIAVISGIAIVVLVVIICAWNAHSKSVELFNQQLRNYYLQAEGRTIIGVSQNNVKTIRIPEGTTKIGNRAFTNCQITTLEIPASVTKIAEDAFTETVLDDIWFHEDSPFAFDEAQMAIVSKKNGEVVAKIPLFVIRNGVITHVNSKKQSEYIIPDKIKGIGPNAFENCSNLTSITIPESVTSIGSRAFYGCTNLTSVTIPKSVKIIGELAFWKTKISSITIPGSVETINEGMFKNFTNLTDVTIQEGVNEIGQDAFSGCTNLTNVTIPKSVKIIGQSAFAKTKISSITIPGSVETIGKWAFSECPNLTNITIQEGVREIAYGAFMRSPRLTKLTIPGSVKTIGQGAFDGCPNLTDVTIQEGVNEIGQGAFMNCTNLTNVTIPKSVKIIGQSAFAKTKISSITIPGSVETIGKLAFEQCPNLTSVTLSEGVKIIGDQAFWKTKISSITIPESVEIIGKWAFSECPNLTNVTIQEGVSEIAYGAFLKCPRLTKLTIPGSVITIGQGAFDGCTNLTDVTIQEGVNKIEKGAFANCTNLTNVTLPGSVNRIGEQAFWKTKISSITIPGSVGSIGYRAFSECPNLTNVTIQEGEDFRIIWGEAFAGCTNLTSITIPNGVREIGRGAFFNSGLTRITIPGSVKTIEKLAFSKCHRLTSVTLKYGVSEISNEAFRYCKNLTSITIPGSVTKIGDRAFWDCGIREIELPYSITKIDQHAFDFNTTIYVPEKKIEWYKKILKVGNIVGY